MSYLENLMKIGVTALQSREKIAFGALCNDKPTVFYFIRRFGCSLCRWGAKDISRIIPVVGDKVNVVAIAPEFLGHEEFTEGSIGRKTFTSMSRKRATNKLVSHGTIILQFL